MNDRQATLIGYLATLNKPQTQEIVVNELLSMGFMAYTFSPSEIKEKTPFHDTNARILLTNDIRAINADMESNAIIITSSKGIRLAQRNEFLSFVRRRYAALWRKKARLDKLCDKYAKDGQGAIDGFVIETFKGAK